jgi:hypothetical protein
LSAEVTTGPIPEVLDPISAAETVAAAEKEAKRQAVLEKKRENYRKKRARDLAEREERAGSVDSQISTDYMVSTRLYLFCSSHATLENFKALRHVYNFRSTAKTHGLLSRSKIQ